MNWFYAAGGKPQGPVSQIELDRLLAEGKLTPKTEVWREGMRDWLPLWEARPELDPANLRCARCGDFYPAAQMLRLGGSWYCPRCEDAGRAETPEEPPALEVAAEAPEGRTGPPWEQRELYGPFSAALRTVALTLTQPSRTFARMLREGGLMAPLAFAVLVGTLGHIALSLYVFWVARSGSPDNYPPEFAKLIETFASPNQLFSSCVQAPLVVLLHVFVISGLVHVILRLLGGGTRTFQVTARVVCYTYGSAMALQFFPGLGAVLFVPWMLIVLMVGLAKAHEIDGWQASIAVLIPLGLGFVLFVGAAAAAGVG